MTKPIAGYNVRLDGVVENDTLIKEASPFKLNGLDSGTEYKDRITVTAVDLAGLESTPYHPLSAKTLSSTYTDPPMSQAGKDAISAIVNNYLATTAFPYGVTVGVTGPFGHMVQSFGTSDGTTPMTPDMHFRIGSITKTFTQTAVLMQVDKGLISLDDPLSKYVTGVPNGDTITIRQMMMMRSGVIDDQTNTTMTLQLVLSPTGAWSPDNTLAYIRKGPNGFAPGEQYQYTNSNYILLGYVLKAATGRAVRDIILQDIITPLGLTETTWPLDSNIPAPYSHGYWANPLSGIPIIGPLFGPDITAINPELADSAGALTSTVGDLIKWGQELRDGTLLSPASQLLRNTFFPYDYPASLPKSVKYPDTFKYGLGYVKVGAWRGHDGSWPGFDGCVMWEPSTGSVIVIWENMQTIGLLSLSELWADIADYCYPGSTMLPDYLSDKTLHLKGIHRNEKFGRLKVKRINSFRGIPANERFGRLTVAGGFRPYTEVNVDYTNQPWPVGAQGCYFTGIGAGGSSGGSGEDNSDPGGAPGGGAARVDRIYIPRPDGDNPLFTATLGKPGLPGKAGGWVQSGATVGSKGGDGGDTSFVTGALQAIAGGGKGGPGSSAVPGAAGVATLVGVTGLTTNGSPGGQDNAGNAGAGGGQGGSGSGGSGTRGGSSKTVPGGTAGSGNGQNGNVPAQPGGTPADAAPGDGGAGGGGGGGELVFFGSGHGRTGGAGGKYGGGAGGPGGANVNGGVAQMGSPGGIGYNKLEWV